MASGDLSRKITVDVRGGVAASIDAAERSRRHTHLHDAAASTSCTSGFNQVLVECSTQKRPAGRQGRVQRVDRISLIDGYIRDLKTNAITNQGHSFTARAKLLLKPTDTFSLILTFGHGDFDDPTGTLVQNLRPAPLLALLGGGPIASDRFHSSNDFQQYLRTNTDEIARAQSSMSAVAPCPRSRRICTTSSTPRASWTKPIFRRTLVCRADLLAGNLNFASSPDKALTYVIGAYYFRTVEPSRR